MGRLMRSHDWSDSALGAPATWPQPLRTAVRLILNTGHPMYVIWGAAGACLYNDAFRPSVGPERHPSSLGCPVREVWGEIWDLIGPDLEHVMAGQGATWHENQLVPFTRNGMREDVYWTYSYGPIDDEAAAAGVGGVLVVCTETTASVLAKQRLAAETTRQRRLFEQAPGFIAILRGPEHVFDFANKAYVRTFGGRDVIGKTVREAFPEVAGQGFFELLDEVYRSGQRFVASRIPITLQSSSDVAPEQYFLDFIYEAIPDETGAITGIFLEGHDVSDQKRTEDALRQLNETLEQQVEDRTRDLDRVWRSSRDLFMLCGYDGLCRSANPAWAEALGYAPSELVGTRFDRLVHPDDFGAVGPQVERLRGGGFVRDLDLRLRAKDGASRWYSWSCVPEGDVFYAAGRDVTDRKQLEEQLRQSQKMEAVGQLTGGLAHDFNNLLTAIVGNLELTRTRLAQGRVGEVDRYVAAAQEAAWRAAALTHRLLAFSRRQTLDPKPTDIALLIGGMEELIRRTMGPAIAVEVVAAPGLWTILVDRNQLENALLNLCINARDAMPEGGRLTIQTANRRLDEHAARERELPPGQYLTLCVADTGAGMTAEVMARAFDPFFTTKPIGMGTRLGLSMIYGFAQQSGGQAQIRSEPDRGTTICLTLPRHSGGADVADGTDRPVAASHAGRGETVLVVDDEPTVRALAVEVLRDLGYRAIEAEDGAAGLLVLRSDARVDLLVTDVGLPGGLNGRQLADAGQAVRPGLSVLFITGYAENAALSDGQLGPGMHVLTKPFTLEQLTGRIRELIAGA